MCESFGCEYNKSLDYKLVRTERGVDFVVRDPASGSVLNRYSSDYDGMPSKYDSDGSVQKQLDADIFTNKRSAININLAISLVVGVVVLLIVLTLLI